MPLSVPNLNFLRGGGEMGEYTRNYNWSFSSIGTPDQWPQSLRSTVSTILNSKFPMFLWWGKDLIQFYNDAYRPSLGDNGKHPEALGANGVDTWPEIWPVIYPLIEQVMGGGESIWMENQLIPIYRNGSLENVYWTFSYSPVLDDSGAIGGVLVTCTETTNAVIRLQQLAQSEQRFLNLTRQATLGIIVLTGDDFEVGIVNEAYATLIGRTVENLRGQNLFDIIPETEDVFRPIIESVKRTGEELHLYNQYYSIDSKDFKKEGYLNLIYQPYREIDGTITGVIVMCQDVTVQVLDQKQKEENELLLRTVIDNTPVATALFLRENLLIALANDVMIGYWKKGKNVIGQPYREAVPELNGQGYFEILNNVFETGKEYHAVGARADIETNGKITTQYFNYSYTPLFNEKGDVYAVLNMGYDVTDLTIAQQLKEENQQKLVSSFENSPVGIAIISGEDLVFDMANTFYSIIAGRSTEQLIGKPLLEAIPELDGQGFDTQLKNVLKTGETFKAKEAPVTLSRNGETTVIYIDHSYQAQRDSHGEIVSVLVVVIEVTQQVLARQKIENSEKRFRSLIEEAPIGTCLYVGPDMRIEIANKIIMDYWGRGPEVIGKNMIDVFPETRNQPFPQILKEVYRTGKLYEQKGARADIMIRGVLTTLYFDFTYKPLFDSNGEVYAILDVAVDVTEQVKANKLMTKNQEFIRKIFYNSPVPKLVFTGKEMILEEANEKMLELLGRDQSIIGLPIKQIVEELNKTILIQDYKKVLKTGETIEKLAQQFKFVKNDTVYTGYYDYTLKPLFDDDEKVYGVICIVIEVTDKVYARQKQQEAEASLRGAVELAQLGTWSIDVATNGLTYSDRLIEWFGFDPANKDYSEVIPILSNVDQQRVSEAVAWALDPKSGGVYDQIYTVIHPKTGDKKILHAQGKTVFDLSGNPVKMNGTAQDVTLQYEVQTALEQQVRARTEELATAVEDLEKSNVMLLHSNEELAQFAYVASHDLQEPLRKISTFSQILEGSLGENAGETTKGYISKIVQSSTRMRTLINDVLNYSQLVKNKEQFSDVNLNEIIKDLIFDYDLLIEEKHATIIVEELPVIPANPLEMTQLFRNLISNSLKFSKKDVTPILSISVLPVEKEDIISISGTKSPECYCKIQVKDNGIGFEAEYFQRIFNIFQRLHTKSAYEGTGIGLAMCKKIAQNHGGDIFAAATPGEGAVFSVILPL